jgi:hypothetical protein
MANTKFIASKLMFCVENISVLIPRKAHKSTWWAVLELVMVKSGGTLGYIKG